MTTTLHILNKSPDHPRFVVCMKAVAQNDQLLLTENAVLALADAGVSLPAGVRALSADLKARGLTQQCFSQYGIGFDDMVQLTIQNTRVISW